MLYNFTDDYREQKYRKTNNVINVMTAASPPSLNTLEDIEESGFLLRMFMD